MLKKILSVLIVLCTVFTAVELGASAISKARTTSTTTTTTASSNSIAQITVGSDNTATLTASSVYGAASAYRKDTNASRWTKISATSKNTYGGVIANYDVYSVVMADLESKYPLAEGYTYSSINIVATATISVNATNATAYNAVSVYYNSAAQSAQATAYKSALSRTAFTFKNSKNGTGTISVPAVSEANPYLVVYAASPVNTISLYVPTVSISYSYTASIVKVATNEDTTAVTNAQTNTSSTTSTTTSAPTTTTTTQAPIITTSKAPSTTNTTKKNFLSGWCPWL